MKNLFYLLFVLPLLFSCGDASGDSTGDETKKDSSTNLDVERYHRNEIQMEEMSGICRLKKNNKLVTGIIYQEWDNGNLMEEVNYKNGQRNGRSQEWYESGQQRCDYNYIDGYMKGRQRLWNKSGQLVKDEVWGPEDY